MQWLRYEAPDQTARTIYVHFSVFLKWRDDRLAGLSVLDYLRLGGRNLLEKAEDGVVISQVAAVRAATGTWLPDLTFLDLVDNGTAVTQEVLNIRAFPEADGKYRCEAIWRRNVTALISWPGLSFTMFVRRRPPPIRTRGHTWLRLCTNVAGPAVRSLSGPRISISGRNALTGQGASPQVETDLSMTPPPASRTMTNLRSRAPTVAL